MLYRVTKDGERYEAGVVIGKDLGGIGMSRVGVYVEL